MPDNETFDPNAVPETSQQAEALYNHLQEGTAPEVIDSAPSPEVVEPEHKINYKGKEETYPIQKILEFAQQGRDYSSKMRELRLQREEMSKQWPQDLTDRLKRYTDIEGYIKTNPQWWEHLQKQWNERNNFTGQTSQDAPQANNPVIQNLVQTVEALKTQQDQLTQERLEQKRTQEDEALDAQIQEYREKYPHFDWNTLDDTNHNLEQRVLDYAIKNGIRSFKAAANDFLFDEHLKRANTSAKEDVGKQIQKATKLGLGPVTDKRTLAIPHLKNVASKSWDEIADEARQALGI